MVTLVADPHWRLPGGVVVSIVCMAQACACEPGMPFGLEADVLRIGENCMVTLERARPVDTTVSPNASSTAPRIPPALLARSGMAALGRPVQHRFQLFCSALAAGRMDAAADALQGGLGLGPGLTPSFDDAAVGALAAFASHLEDFSTRMEELASLRPLLKRRTTAVSAHYLSCAFDGCFSGLLKDVIYGLPDAVPALAGVGATSGRDMLWGVRFALLTLAVPEVLRDREESGANDQARTGAIIAEDA